MMSFVRVNERFIVNTKHVLGVGRNKTGQCVMFFLDGREEEISEATYQYFESSALDVTVEGAMEDADAKYSPA